MLKKMLKNWPITRNKLDFLFLLIAVFLGIYLGWKIMEIITFAVLVFIILKPIPSRYLAFPSLFFLSLTPIFLVWGKKEIADRLAIYAYFFLAMTVLMGIYEIWQDKEGKEPVKKIGE